MSLADHVTSLVSTTARLAVRAVDAAPVPGAVRGAVRSVAHAVAGGPRQQDREARAAAWSAPTDDVPRPEPTPPGEAVFTEPTASSRREAHGGPAGRHGDDWRDELDDDLVDPAPLATPDEPTDEPLIKPGAARALRKEAEVMKRGASPTS